MTPGLARAIPFFPYPQAFLQEEEDLLGIFRDVGRRGAFIEQEDLRRFEENLARFMGARRVIGAANATDGLLIALRAAGVEPGTEVIFSSHTMVATAAAIHFAGAIPVPVECGADHLMNPQAAAAAITPRTSAILPTQLNGRTADMDALEWLASRDGLLMVEDADIRLAAPPLPRDAAILLVDIAGRDPARPLGQPPQPQARAARHVQHVFSRRILCRPPIAGPQHGHLHAGSALPRQLGDAGEIRGPHHFACAHRVFFLPFRRPATDSRTTPHKLPAP